MLHHMKRYKSGGREREEGKVGVFFVIFFWQKIQVDSVVKSIFRNETMTT